MRIVIVAGGTGGHLYPGMAVAQELKHWAPRAKVRFIGSKGGPEHEILAREGYLCYDISAGGLVRRPWRQQLVSLTHLVRGVGESMHLLRRLQPQVVLGLGSYVAGPVLLAAWILGIPRLIHEQNVVPGLANRVLGHVVDRVAVSFGDSVPYFPKAKTIITGNPVRPTIWQARARAHEPNGRFHVLVFGGSQGAHRLNLALLEALPQLTQLRERLWIVHQTGRNDHAHVQAAYAKSGCPGEVQIYIQDMAAAYSAADLVICRAGATTIAELTAIGKPAILVPFPYAAHDHQEQNARVLASSGAADLIRDRDLSGSLVAERIGYYLQHPKELAEMAARSLALGRPDAAMRVAHLCLELCRI